MQIRLDDNDSFDGLERAAKVVALVLRMLVGLGLAVGLVVKVYMLVLTDLTCDPEATGLGNLIRCTSILDLIAGSILLITGLGLAAALISSEVVQLRQTLSMAICGVLLAFLSDVSVADASWEIALVLLALTVPLAFLILFRSLNSRNAPKATHTSED